MVDAFLELLEVLVVFSSETFGFHEFPHPLNQVQVRRIRRQKQQFDAQRLRFLLHQCTTLVTGIVHDQCHGRAGMLVRQRLQEFTNRQRIDVGGIHHRSQLLGDVIQGPQNIVPLSPGWRAQKEPHKTPQIAQKSAKDKMAGVTKKILRLPCSASSKRGFS